MMGAGKSTQRIVLPGRAEAPAAEAAPMAAGTVALPAAMLIRVLPPEILSMPPKAFEESPDANQECALPLGLILPQLPSGKIEMTVQDVVPHIPRSCLKSDGEIAEHLSKIINLPLMDVVMRIPPDVLAIRPDQKDVDAAVLNMADPFTEQILAEQAAAARAAKAAAAAAAEPAASKIIEESEVPAAEEFVPQVETPAVEEVEAVPEPVAEAPIPEPFAADPFIPEPAPEPEPEPQAEPAPEPEPFTAAVPEAAAASGPWSQSDDFKKLLAEAEAAVGEALEEPASEAAPVETAAAAPEASVPEAVPPAPAASPATHKDSSQFKFVPATRAPQTQAHAGSSATAPLPDFRSKPAVPPPATRSLAPEPKPLVPPTVPLAVEPKVPAPLAPPPPPPPVPAPMAKAPASPPVPVAPAPVLPARTEFKETDLRPVPQPGDMLNIDLNSCTVDDLQRVPGCPKSLAESIVQYRERHGTFQQLEDLLRVPGITPVTFALLTGYNEPLPPKPPMSVNELLGFPNSKEVSFKEIADKVMLWPEITGCVLGDRQGLPLVGMLPASLDTKAVMAFAPKMFASVNGSFGEFTGREADEIALPMKDGGFHFFHHEELYIVVTTTRRQLARRQAGVLRKLVREIVRTRKSKP
jgi:competence ComEA-like helix-hairpin-helix protein